MTYADNCARGFSLSPTHLPCAKHNNTLTTWTPPHSRLSATWGATHGPVKPFGMYQSAHTTGKKAQVRLQHSSIKRKWHYGGRWRCNGSPISPAHLGCQPTSIATPNDGGCVDDLAVQLSQQHIPTTTVLGECPQQLQLPREVVSLLQHQCATAQPDRSPCMPCVFQATCLSGQG